MSSSFEHRAVRLEAGEFPVWIGGSGPPVLLLHGYPQTHAMWRDVAPRLAERHTVVLADLRGYGAAPKPPGDPEHRTYAKRTMAADMAALMEELGFPRFAVVGHDRGGRVAHRLALDRPERVEKLAVLDIVPTRTVFAATDRELALGYFHWFFLAQPAPLPERMIGADPDFWLETLLARWSGTRDLAPFAGPALESYRAAFRDPATIHATCEDYRAAATIDLEHDAADADRRIACPLLVLWGAQGLMHRLFDVLATWREKAAGPVFGRALPCGHFLPEEAPEATASALADFLAS
ncbi:MAG: alpha/beta hydrolase [Geminicoccaceae bacterium]|nr:alpha/beta hydrolase [Geminicoccaceae bacterium]